MNPVFKKISVAGLSAVALLTASVSHGQYQQSGPAAGGGLSSYQDPTAGGPRSYDSSEFRKMGCKDREMRVGKDKFYDCNGMILKREYVGGRVRYVETSGG